MFYKLIIAGVFSISLLVFGGGVATVSAVSDNSRSQTTTTTSTQTTTATTTGCTTTECIAAMTNRIQTRVTTLNLALTAAQQARIQSQCKKSQGVVQTFETKLKNSETKRAEAYQNILDNLDSLTTKLKAQKVDTVKFEADITILKTKITTYTTDFASYKEVVSDLAAMTCEANAVGFQATLQTARTAQAKVKQDATNIRDFINKTIKPDLVTIRQAMDKAKNSAASSATTSGGN